MAAEPGPTFRWGVVLRKSQLNADGTEESTDRHELELVCHIRHHNMGVIVQSYKDIASGWKPGAPRPRFKHALVDLASGTIDGIAVLSIDRLTRRVDQVRPILNALEEMGGRLFALWDDLDTADGNPESNTDLRLGLDGEGHSYIHRKTTVAVYHAQGDASECSHGRQREYAGGLIELHQVPAILPEQLWQQVCEKLGPRYTRIGRREGRPLANLVLCGLCGRTLIGDTDKGTPVYVCKKRPAQPGACGGITVVAARLEERVDEEIVSFLRDRRRVEGLLQQQGLTGPELDAIDARYAELEDNKLALEEAAFNPPPAGIKRLPPERYWKLRTPIEHEQDELRRRRVVDRELDPLKVALKQTWSEERWQEKPLDWRRAVIQLVTERIEVHRPAVVARRGRVGGQFDPERVKIKLAA
jgi:hypothetical protein